MTRGECVDIEEDRNGSAILDEHDDVSIETVVDELKVTEDGDYNEDEDSSGRQTSATHMHDVSSDDEDLFVGQQTPPKQLQEYFEDVPLVTEYGYVHIMLTHTLFYCFLTEYITYICACIS